MSVFENGNVYYNPEKFGREGAGGAKILAQEDIGGSYEFDIYLLVRYENKLWFAQDSGCSCPTPFESVGPDQLTPVESVADLKRLRDQHNDNPHDFWSEALDIVTEEYRGR